MRGEGDTASPTLDERVSLTVFTAQQIILKSTLGTTSLNSAPKMWCVYKEVGGYYHFDYVGDPRNYKWINIIQLSKTWQQMHLAHQKTPTRIWIVHFGELKPLQIPISHFLDMAYDMSNFITPDIMNKWLEA